MLVPIGIRILLKTLSKWTTPQRKRSAKFKRILNPVTTTTSLIHPSTTTTTRKQYHPSTSASFRIVSILIIAVEFLLRTVIKYRSSLMNDFRTTSRYTTTTTITNNKSTLIALTTTTTTTSSLPLPLSPSSSSSVPQSTLTSFKTTIDSKLFNNNNYKNNHRTYNNSGKSNKVFLHYIPRDPRLRIFPQHHSRHLATFNKHLCIESASELKITEDLCNYGELIGGFGDCNQTFNKHCFCFGYCYCVDSENENCDRDSFVDCDTNNARSDKNKINKNPFPELRGADLQKAQSLAAGNQELIHWTTAVKAIFIAGILI